MENGQVEPVAMDASADEQIVNNQQDLSSVEPDLQINEQELEKKIQDAVSEMMKKGRYPRKCVTDFYLDEWLLGFLGRNAFFSEISRHLQLIPTEDLPTAAVMFNGKEDSFIFYYNPKYCKALAEKDSAILNGLIYHEFFHIVFNHLAWGRTPRKLWNIAEDLSINSLIKKLSLSDKKWINYDRSWYVPGTIPFNEKENREFTDEELKEFPMIEIVKDLPDDASSTQYYFELCRKGADKFVNDNDEFDFYGFVSDVHGNGDKINEDYLKAKIDAMVEKAVKAADASGSWGDIPQELRRQIRASCNKTVDWTSILSQWIGFLNRGKYSTSYKRLNKKYPYIHPGVQYGTMPRLLVAVDQSGSVYDQLLEKLYGALSSLSIKVDIDVIPFDCSLSEKDIFTWKKGMAPPTERVREGGTDFNAPTRFVNDPKNRGRWEGLLIATDGEAPSPEPCIIKRGWVLPSECKLNFETQETVIIVNDDK